MKKAIARIHLVVLYVVMGFLLHGCGGPIEDFFTARYENVVAYFNTYYNAKKLFEESEQEILKARSAAPDSNMFRSYTVPPAVRTKLLSVIEKCSKIIQFHDKSKWVDDALLLIGKSYYYQNEMLPARKKFLELLEHFPNSDFRFEAKLGVAKTAYRSENGAELIQVVKELVPAALEEKEGDIAAEALLVQGQYYSDLGDYMNAAKQYSQTAAINADDPLLAHAQYRLGTIREAQGDYVSAREAYLGVLKHDPDFEMEFKARLRAGVTASLTGQHEEALKLFDQLRGELLNSAERSLLDLETANIYNRRGDYEQALFTYKFIDSLYVRTDVSAKSYFQQGILYETAFQDLPAAKSYYDKAVAEFPTSEVVVPAKKKSETIGRYMVYKSALKNADSLLAVMLHPQSPQPKDTVTYQSDSTMTKGELPAIASDSTTAPHESPSAADTARTGPPAVAISKDTLHFRRATNEFALGILFFLEFGQSDSAAYWLESLLHEYPESDLVPRAIYALGEIYRNANRATEADSLSRILVDKFPDSDYAKHSRYFTPPVAVGTSVDPSDSLYMIGEGLLRSGDYMRAIGVFQKIAQGDTASPSIPRARYAIGWIYENVLTKNDSAVVQYRRIVQKYPTSVYAVRVRDKLDAYDANRLDTTVVSKASKPQGLGSKQKQDQAKEPPQKTNETRQPDEEQPREQSDSLESIQKDNPRDVPEP